MRGIRTDTAAVMASGRLPCNVTWRVDGGVWVKRCASCREVLRAEQFGIVSLSASPLRLQSYCRSCRRRYAADYAARMRRRRVREREDGAAWMRAVERLAARHAEEFAVLFASERDNGSR